MATTQDNAVKALIEQAYNDMLATMLRVFLEAALTADSASTDEALGNLKRGLVKLKWAIKTLEDELCD